MPRKQRFKLRFTFWLDMLNNGEQDLATYVEELKSQRFFVKTIRDGLLLMRDLRGGRVDVLFELFPWVKSEFLASVISNHNSGATGNELRRDLEQIKDLLLRNTTSPLVATPSGTPRSLHIPAPDFPSIFASVDERANPSEARKAFAGGMGDLFADDDDDDFMPVKSNPFVSSTAIQ